MFGLDRRDLRRAFRTVVYAGVTVALVAFVWLHFDGLAEGDRGALAKMALGIVGAVVILHATEHVTKIVSVDGLGMKLRVGGEAEGAREAAEAAEDVAEALEERAGRYD